MPGVMSSRSSSLLDLLKALPTELLVKISKHAAHGIYSRSAMEDEKLGWLQPLNENALLPLNGIQCTARTMVVKEWLENTPFYLKLIDLYTKDKLISAIDQIRQHGWPCIDAEDKTKCRIQHLWLRIDCTRASQRILPLFYKIHYSGPNQQYSVEANTSKVPWGFPEYVRPHIEMVKSIIEDKLAELQSKQVDEERDELDCIASKGLSLDDIQDIAATVLMSTNVNYLGTSIAVKKAWEKWQQHSFL